MRLCMSLAAVLLLASTAPAATFDEAALAMQQAEAMRESAYIAKAVCVDPDFLALGIIESELGVGSLQDAQQQHAAAMVAAGNGQAFGAILDGCVAAANAAYVSWDHASLYWFAGAGF